MPCDLGPGDIVFLSGRGHPHDRIKSIAGSPWIQVGIVVSLHGERGLLECTSRPSCACIETGTPATWVATTPLALRLATFAGEVAVRRHRTRPEGSRLDALMAFRERTLGIPFDMNVGSSRRLLQRRHRVAGLDAFLCGPYVAAALQASGMLPLPPSGPLHANVAPWDLAGLGQPLSFAEGTDLEDLAPIGD